MGQLPNLDGRWTSPPENYSVNIVMTGNAGDGAFNMKAISPELLKYWQGGYGQVFESRKLRATFTGEDENGNFFPKYIFRDLYHPTCEPLRGITTVYGTDIRSLLSCLLKIVTCAV